MDGPIDGATHDVIPTSRDLAWYESGLTEGLEVGRDQLEAEIAAMQRLAVRSTLHGLRAREVGVFVPGVAE